MEIYTLMWKLEVDKCRLEVCMRIGSGRWERNLHILSTHKLSTTTVKYSVSVLIPTKSITSQIIVLVNPV